MEYKVGDKVLFIDENQCEIRGRIKEIIDEPKHYKITIDLDDERGYYVATIKKKIKKFRIVGGYVDPYTLELIPLDKIISIGSEEAARNWVKQSYYKAIINRVERVK